MITYPAHIVWQYEQFLRCLKLEAPGATLTIENYISVVKKYFEYNGGTVTQEIFTHQALVQFYIMQQ